MTAKADNGTAYIAYTPSDNLQGLKTVGNHVRNTGVHGECLHHKYVLSLTSHVGHCVLVWRGGKGSGFIHTAFNS